MSIVRHTQAKPRARYALALAALFAISLAIRAIPPLMLHFDGLYGQDAYAYYSYGHQVLDAFSHFQLPGHFYWPLGYPMLVGLGFILTGEQPLGPQIISLVCGAAVSVFIYLLTVEICRAYQRTERFARLAGIVAWAVTAVCGQLIQSSFVIMSDAPGLMWATLSAWALVVYGRTRAPAWIALSAFGLAWATMTRWQYGVLALPWALYVLASRPVRWRQAGLAFVVGMVTLAPQIAHSIQNPDPLINHEWLQGWSASNALGHDFITADGTFHYDQSPAQYYAQPLYNVYYMSPLLLPLAVIGLLLANRLSPLVLLIGWIAMQYGFLMGIPYENIRFALAIVPPIAVAVGIGAAWLILYPGRFRLFVAPITVFVVLYGLFATLRTSAPIFSGFIAAKNADLEASYWIEQNIPEPGATVYCLDLLLTMQHYTRLQPIQIYQMTPDQLSAQLAQAAAQSTPSRQLSPAYAVFNVWTTEHQWYGQSPWTIYHWLLKYGMTEIGTYGNYTLYRINQ